MLPSMLVLMRLRLVWMVTLVAAGALTVFVPSAVGASAAGCSAASTHAPSPGTVGNTLRAVAAPSACSAWAVGDYIKRSTGERPLIEHWNGKAWKVQPSANPGVHKSKGRAELYGVAAAGGAAWAVGVFLKRGPSALIERWDGKSWKIEPSPNPRGGELFGVAAASSSVAWAVGAEFRPGTRNPLIERWNGKSWRVEPRPKSSHDAGFESVTALSPHDAWAVGWYMTSSGSHRRTLIEHWNGKSWQAQSSPDPGTFSNELLGVTAASPTSAWAVGYDANAGGGQRRTLIEHWNGTSWQVQPTPSLAGSSSAQLASVAAASGTHVWAAGSSIAATNEDQTLIEQWNGKAWQVDPSPNSSSTVNELLGVAAVSSTGAFAVGDYLRGGAFLPLVEHWNRTVWTG
jgi:hypothetical protein